MTENGSGGSAIVSLYIKRGIDSIAAGQTSKNIAHGLGYAPTGYVVSPITNSLGVDIFVSAVDATNITVAMDFVQADIVAFSWVCS